MSQIYLPGKNTIVLCAAAVQEIVQAHLRNAMYASREERPTRVTDVKYDASSHTFAFDVTTDPEQQA